MKLPDPDPDADADTPITAHEVRAIIGRELRGISAIEDAAMRGRVAAVLAGAAMRAIETSDLQARVDAVERILRARRAGSVSTCPTTRRPPSCSIPTPPPSPVGTATSPPSAASAC